MDIEQNKYHFVFVFSHQRLMSDESEAVKHASTQRSAILELPKLKRLQTLVLKDYGNMEVSSKKCH